MEKMKKQIIRKIAISICIMTVVVSVCNVCDVSALSSAQYTKQTVDRSTEYKKTKAEVYYQLVQLKGDSTAIQKINKAIRKDCIKFLDSSNTKSLKGYAKISKEKETYCWKAKASVKYNKKGIISILVDTYWWAGGVSNTNRYGLNYSLKTGKKIYLHQACKKSKKATKKKLYRAVKKRVAKQQEDQGALKVIKKKKIKKINFYIKKNGKVYATFGPYELGMGGWFREYKVGRR